MNCYCYNYDITGFSLPFCDSRMNWFLFLRLISVLRALIKNEVVNECIVTGVVSRFGKEAVREYCLFKETLLSPISI